MTSSCYQNINQDVGKPKIEFLLKQVYAAYKEDIKLLSDQLSEAKMPKRSPCSFCSLLKDQVESLRYQLNELLQRQHLPIAKTVDACIQTDEGKITPEGAKRKIKFSPSRTLIRYKLEKSPNKANFENEVILAPSTPERNPQRDARVKKWLETMEIPETVDPYIFYDKVDFSPSLIGNNVRGQKEKPNASQIEEDMDATMLPLSYFQKSNSFQHQNKNEQLNHTSVSEDLLDDLNFHYNVHDMKKNVLGDVGNKQDAKEIAAKCGSPIKFKFKGDPVRKKQERRRLPGHQCADCARFYEGDRGMLQKNICSKHRATNVAPDTPDNFWELDFPDTQVCKERGYMDITQALKIRPRRKRPLKQLDQET